MGVKVVLVHGFRPQVNEQLLAKGHTPQVCEWPAHHRQRGAGLRPRGRGSTALRNRSGFQPRPAQHPHGRCHGAGDVGQLHHRPPGGRGRWGGLPTFGRGAQSGRARHHPNPARGGGGAALALWFFADGRGLQPHHGRSRHLGGLRLASRQIDFCDRNPRHPGAPQDPAGEDNPIDTELPLAAAEALLAQLPQPNCPPTSLSTCSIA
jgi:amino-acid N-acetyltransferase